MTSELAAVVPGVMAPFCRDLVVAEAGETVPPLAPAAIRDALDDFGRRFVRPDPAALASFWSMYYLNALLIPAAAEVLCRDRIIPVGADEVGLRLDGSGLPKQVVLSHGGRPACAADGGHRFDTLVRGQLAPFVAMMVGATPVTARVLWSNAGAVLDWVVNTVGVRALPAARTEALALLAGTAPAVDPCRRLAEPLRESRDGGRERRVCCTRYRLSNTGACIPICPARDAALAARGGPALACGAARL